jgi:hypothetical protein
MNSEKEPKLYNFMTNYSMIGKVEIEWLYKARNEV